MKQATWKKPMMSPGNGKTPNSITHHLLVGAALLAAIATASASASFAESGDQASVYYADAAIAFRKGDYQSAIELYQAADRAGFNDLALQYNLGVSYYKLNRFADAEAAFATASTADKLAPLSYYNLGLVALKVDDKRDAHGWFQQVIRNPETSAKLRDLAEQAVDTLPKVARRRPAKREADPQLGDFLSFSFKSGVAYDSNIYRAPVSEYLDLTDPTQPLSITPTEQSGSFVPVEADVGLQWGTSEHGRFFLDYNFDGRIYTDSEYSNANAFRNEVSVGGKTIVPEKKGYRYLRSQFSFTRFDENYYDRDDGQDQLIGTTDVSDRFNRTRIGPSIYYHRKRTKLGYGWRAEGYANDYADTLDYLDLSNQQYLAGVHVSYYPWRTTEIRTGFDWSRREYSRRKAKSSSGIRFANNDDLEYDYQNYQATLRQKLSQRTSTVLSYRYTIRDDNFEGYDDYTRHTGRASLRYKSRRLEIQTGLTYRLYDFPNAFTFDLIGQGQKDLDTTYAHVNVDYEIMDGIFVRLEALRDMVNASDPRSEYDRDQIAMSLAWQL